MRSRKFEESNSSSNSWGSKKVFYCDHNEVAPLRVVRVKGRNFGRRFYGCIHYPEHCGFFKWENDVGETEELNMKILAKDRLICDLEQEKAELQQMLNKLRGKRKAVLEDELYDLMKEIRQVQLKVVFYFRVGFFFFLVTVVVLFMKSK